MVISRPRERLPTVGANVSPKKYKRRSVNTREAVDNKNPYQRSEGLPDASGVSVLVSSSNNTSRTNSASSTSTAYSAGKEWNNEVDDLRRQLMSQPASNNPPTSTQQKVKQESSSHRRSKSHSHSHKHSHSHSHSHSHGRHRRRHSHMVQTRKLRLEAIDHEPDVKDENPHHNFEKWLNSQDSVTRKEVTNFVSALPGAGLEHSDSCGSLPEDTPLPVSVRDWEPHHVEQFLSSIALAQKWAELAAFAKQEQITGVELLSNAATADGACVVFFFFFFFFFIIFYFAKAWYNISF